VGAVRLTAALVAAAAALVLLVLLAPRIGRARAAGAAVTFLLAASSTYVEGYDLNAEHILLATGTAAVALALALGPSANRAAPLLVGLAGGVAILTKAVFGLTLAALLIPLLAGRRARGQSAASTAALLACGAAIPPLAVRALFAAAGAGADFWEGNIGWNLSYVAAADGQVQFPSRLAPVGVLALAALALGLLRLRRDDSGRVLNSTLLAWLLAASAGAFVGGREFPHYFAPLIAPAAALLWLPWPRSGARAAARRTVASVTLAVAVTAPFAVEVARGFTLTGPELSARQYGALFASVWSRTYEVGQELRERARPGDRLFVIGAEPGFNLYSGIAPPSRYFFNFDYPVVPAGWRRDLRRHVCERPPRFVVSPWGNALEPGCAPPGRYRELLTRPLTTGGRLTVFELAEPQPR
jgi:4-amino-4-deoxy-L-arabinose transferase-like glycosyltransferase